MQSYFSSFVPPYHHFNSWEYHPIGPDLGFIRAYYTGTNSVVKLRYRQWSIWLRHISYSLTEQMKEKISTGMLVFEETFTDGDKESVMVELWQ